MYVSVEVCVVPGTYEASSQNTQLNKLFEKNFAAANKRTAEFEDS